MLIEVHAAECRRRQFTSAAGRPVDLREQAAWFHQPGQPYPVPLKLTLPKDQPEPYAVGKYTLDPSSFYVDRFGALNVSPRLKPVPPSPAR